MRNEKLSFFLNERTNFPKDFDNSFFTQQTIFWNIFFNYMFLLNERLKEKLKKWVVRER